MSFGEQLQAVRRRNGLTQEEFAAQMKVSRQAVSKWESSRGYPEIEKIIYICNRYGVSMNDLFEEEVPRLRQQEASGVADPYRERTLKKDISEFFSNLSPLKKRIVGAILAAGVLLILLMLHHMKGEANHMMTMIWTAAIILFGVVEAATAGLVCIWFAVGAVAALLTAVFSASVPLQIGVFLVASAAALALTRPLVKRLTQAQMVPTNLDQVIGKMARVTEAIDNESSVGAVYVDGKTWTARTVDEEIIPAGAQVRICRIEGVKLFVEKLEEKMEV